MMLRQWIGKNVDLGLLGECIEDFLKGKGFRVSKEELADGGLILTVPEDARDVRGQIAVSIVGNSNDFVVELIAGERARASIRLGFLTSMIGGGRLVLSGLESREALEKFEREFWVYVEETMTHLIGSAEQQV